MSARIAGLAILVAEIVGAQSHHRDKPLALVVLGILVVVQLAALMWATDRRSADALRVVAPAALTGVATAAVWTAFVFAFPVLATGDAFAVAAIAVAGVTAAVWSPPVTARRRRTVVLTASAATALLIFLMISAVLPAVDGFANNWDPPTYYTAVTRLVDPVLEFAVFLLLTLALGADNLWGWARRVRARRDRAPYGGGLNEMVVLPSD